MRNKKFNKKGEIPVVVLVIGVFAVCSLALISFYVSDIHVKESFAGLDTMQEMNIKIENASFYDVSVKDFYLEKNVSEKKWFFLEEEEEVLFSVRYFG